MFDNKYKSKKIDPAQTFYQNKILAGGPASVITCDKKLLLKDVLDGKINPYVKVSD